MAFQDVVASCPGSKNPWRTTALILWAAMMIVLTTLIIVYAGHRSVTPVYHQGVEAWWARAPVYDTPYGMNYLPHFMVLFTPYHFAGESLGGILWLYTAAAALIAGLWLFSRVVLPPPYDRWRAFALATILSLPLSAAALQNGQANAHFGAVLLLAAWCLHTQRWGVAAVCLWLAVAIKPLGLAPMFLAWAVYPQLGWRLALGLPVFLAFPFAFGPWEYVSREFLVACNHLRQCSGVTEHRFADLNGILRTFGIPLTGAASLAVRAAAGALSMVFCYFGVRRTAEPGRALLWLGVATGFLMVFNPMTEANSYIILAPALVLWALWGFAHGQQRLGWVLAGMALTMGLLPNPLRPFLGNYFALAWHPAMTIGFLSILAWQVVQSRQRAVAQDGSAEGPLVRTPALSADSSASAKD